MLAAVGLSVALALALAPDEPGLVDPASGAWHLSDGGLGVRTFFYGVPGDTPFMGDWDCDGVDTPGLYRRSNGFVYLRDANTTGIADVTFFLGDPGDVPLAGDFDGDGCDSISVYRPSQGRVFLSNRLGAAAGFFTAERDYFFGVPGDVPFVGDFDGDGVDTVGLHRATTGFVYLRQSHTQGTADLSFFYGEPDDRLLAGDWTGDGVATPAIFRPWDELFYLQYANRTGVADEVAGLCAGDGHPVAGHFGLDPAATAATVRTTVLSLDRREALPLGGGVAIVAEWPGGSAVLDASGDTAVDLPAGDAELRFTYLGGDGATTGTCWRQTVAATAARAEVVQPWRDLKPARTGGIVLAWQSAGDTERYLGQLDAAPGLTVTSPVWWHIRPDGTLADSSDPALVAAAHQRGLEVWPAIASLEPERAHTALADPDRRRALAADVAARARALGADGVNLDIEGYRQADADAVAEFAADVTAAVHVWGGTTSVDLTMRSEDWLLTVEEGPFWSTAPRRRALAAAVDYVILMAYDQHNRLRPAGPVAAPAWVEAGLRYLLRFANPDQVVLGVPFYSRVWDPADLAAPKAVGLGTIAELAAAGERRPDPAFGVDRVDLADGRFLWAETAAGLAHRTGLVERYGLAGLGAWRLGFDPPEVWEVLAR